jgi:hypothetical protein
MTLPPPITETEISAVMAYPPEVRFSAWMALLAQGRVDVDTVAEAERKVLEAAATVTDDPGNELGGEYGSADWVIRPEDRLNPDLTGGSTLWAFRIGRAIFFTILALGIVTALRLIGRATRWMES